jgi:peptidoglycan/LPS O-acetylase OafA/YrhL
MPALLAMLLVTSALAYVFFTPFELRSFARTLVGALASVSNVVLMRQDGYFDVASKLNPLLHTWSLGVEEQFYLIFPLVLLAVMRWAGRYRKHIFWALTVAGFCLDWYWTLHRNSNEAFYLAPLRAWELMLGILLALGALPALDKPWKRNAASAVGLFLILSAGIQYTQWMPFPSWYALKPSVGALLVLAAGETGSSIAGSLLSCKPIRWVGLISYSLYLWHWPIEVFQTTVNILAPDRYPSWAVKAIVIAVSLVAGAISWRLVEQPFRTGWLRGRTPLFALNGTLFAALLGAGLYLTYYQGWLPQNAPLARGFHAFAKVYPRLDQARWRSCYVDAADFKVFSSGACLADDPTRKHYLLVGDSHSAHFHWGLQTVFPELNISEISVTGCSPLLVHSPLKRGVCDASADFIFNQYLARRPVNVVLLMASWTDWDVDHLEPTIRWIEQHGMKVVVIGPTIQFDAQLPRLITLAEREHDPSLLSRHRLYSEAERDERMARMARDVWHVPYLSMYADLCGVHGADTAGGCPVFGAPGYPILWDTDHTSPQGATLFARAIRERGQLP